MVYSKTHRYILVFICVILCMFGGERICASETIVDDTQAILDIQSNTEDDTDLERNSGLLEILVAIGGVSGIYAFIQIYEFLLNRKSRIVFCSASLYDFKPDNIEGMQVINQCDIFDENKQVEQSQFSNTYYILIQIEMSVPQRLIGQTSIIVKQIDLYISNLKYIYKFDKKRFYNPELKSCKFLLKYPRILVETKNMKSVKDAFKEAETMVYMDVFWKPKGICGTYGLYHKDRVSFQTKGNTENNYRIDIETPNKNRGRNE